MKTLRHARTAAVVAATATLAVVGTTTTGSAATDVGECTQGSAHKAVQAGIVAANHVRQGRTSTGIAEAFGTCTYVLYDDGATYTFSDSDTFAGLTAFTWWDWEGDGLTRYEINDIITGVEYIVELAEVSPDGSLGDYVEHPVVRPPVKYHVMDGQGMTAYQTAGVILDLDVGTYVSRFTFESPDFPEWNSTQSVTLVVTPD